MLHDVAGRYTVWPHLTGKQRVAQSESYLARTQLITYTAQLWARYVFAHKYDGPSRTYVTVFTCYTAITLFSLVRRILHQRTV